MSRFSVARQNMVDGQIRPNGVINPRILEAFQTIPRERFVPEAVQPIAYFDEDLKIDHAGRFLLEAVTHARILEALSPTTNDLVLDVGGTGGYAAAILSKLAATVIALECDESYLKKAQDTWDELALTNIVGVHGALAQGYQKHAPYDLVIINGSVAFVPETLIGQLKPGGRLACVIRRPGDLNGQVTIFESHDTGQGYSSLVLFEAGCPYVPGFLPTPAFSF